MSHRSKDNNEQPQCAPGPEKPSQSGTNAVREWGEEKDCSVVKRHVTGPGGRGRPTNVKMKLGTLRK